MTQKQFYSSMPWRRAREAYKAYRKALDGGMCEVCHCELGKIVHHKVWLNDDNCNDPDIALNPENFRYECQTCHNKEKDGETFYAGAGGRYRFDADGEIIFLDG